MSGSPIACWNMHGPNQVRLVSSTGQPQTGYHLEVPCLEVPLPAGTTLFSWFTVQNKSYQR
jgi:hypothetical protein